MKIYTYIILVSVALFSACQKNSPIDSSAKPKEESISEFRELARETVSIREEWAFTILGVSGVKSVESSSKKLALMEGRLIQIADLLSQVDHVSSKEFDETSTEAISLSLGIRDLELKADDHIRTLNEDTSPIVILHQYKFNEYLDKISKLIDRHFDEN